MPLLVALLLLVSLSASEPAIAGRGGPFSPYARLDGSQVRIVKPDALSFTVGLTLDYIEIVARHRAAHEARPSDWFGID